MALPTKNPLSSEQQRILSLLSAKYIVYLLRPLNSMTPDSDLDIAVFSQSSSSSLLFVDIQDIRRYLRKCDVFTITTRDYFELTSTSIIFQTSTMSEKAKYVHVDFYKTLDKCGKSFFQGINNLLSSKTFILYLIQILAEFHHLSFSTGLCGRIFVHMENIHYKLTV